MISYKVSRRLIVWALAGIAIILLWWIIATWWASIWSWWPWSAEARLKRAEADAEQSEALARSEGARATGEAEIARSVERQTIIIREADRIAADAEIEARTAPDAETPLDPERADRLRRSDERLCASFAGICGAGPDAS